MIIRIKKRDLLIVTLSFIFISLIPLIYSQVDTARGFNAWLTISNTAPNVTLNNVTVGFTVDPIAGGSMFVLISFNVTDQEGVSDIDAETAIVNLTLDSGDDGQFRFNISDTGGEFGSCANHTQDGVVVINCTVEMRFYDNASSSWIINVSVSDLGGATSVNDTITFEVSTLSAFEIGDKSGGEGANLNFTGIIGGDTDKPAKAPLQLNNTGNDDFFSINITGADLLDASAVSIGIANFYVNATNGTETTTTNFGIALVTRGLQIPTDGAANATLLHGPGVAVSDTVPYGDADTAAKGNLSIYFWADVPGGTASGTYNATWNLTVTTVLP